MPRKKQEEDRKVEVCSLYSGRVEVKFYPEAKRNRYVVSIDGQDTKPPSVTQISSVYDKSSALMNWAINNTVDSVRDSILPGMSYNEAEIEAILAKAKNQSNWLKTKAAEIGTLTHDWLFRWIKGEVTEMPPKDSVWRPCVDASLAFIEEHHVKFLNVEQAIYSIEHGYSGRMDADAEIDGELGLIDWKSGNGIHEDAYFQSSAYDRAREEELGLKYDARWIVRLGKLDGRFYKHKLPRETRDRDFHAFLGLKSAYEAAKHINKQIRAAEKEARTETGQMELDWLKELEEA